MSTIVQKTATDKVLLLGAREYLIYPFTINNNNWTEIRIGIETYVTNYQSSSGIPLIEQFSNQETTFGGPVPSTKNIFYFGLKETGRNLLNPLPLLTGNNFIGYIARNVAGTAILSSCVPTVNNDQNTCAVNNIAPPNSNAYRIIATDSNYFTTLKDGSCTSNGPSDRFWGFDQTFLYDIGDGNLPTAIGSYLPDGNNSTDGFLCSASGVPNSTNYVTRNGMSITVANKNQTGQQVTIKFFNDPNEYTPDITGLRKFLGSPTSYAEMTNYYTSGGFDPAQGPIQIPNNLFIYWPFFNNSLAISNIIIEQYA